MRSLDLGQEYLEDPFSHRLTPNEVDVDGGWVEKSDAVRGSKRYPSFAFEMRNRSHISDKGNSAL